MKWTSLLRRLSSLPTSELPINPFKAAPAQRKPSLWRKQANMNRGPVEGQQKGMMGLIMKHIWELWRGGFGREHGGHGEWIRV